MFGVFFWTKYKVWQYNDNILLFDKHFSKVLLEKHYAIAILDVNTEKGQATCEEFRKQYGSECCFFYYCDVANDKMFKVKFD